MAETHHAEATTRRSDVRPRTTGLKSFLIVLLLISAALAKQDSTNEAAAPTAQDVRNLMAQKPLSAATWPEWRDYFARLYFSYDVDEPEEFYDEIYQFLGDLAAAHEGTLPAEFDDDAVAWTALTHYYLKKLQPDAALKCARRARSIDRYSAISAFSLSGTLLTGVRRTWKGGQLAIHELQQVQEAEKLLAYVEQRVPTARLSFWRGIAAEVQGDRIKALPLLEQGARDHPKRPSTAAHYLLVAIAASDVVAPASNLSAPFVESFPDEPHILALHALALFRDQRGAEAAATLAKARRLDAGIDNFLGRDAAELIQAGEWMTPELFQASDAMQKKQYAEAAKTFRRALHKNPQNVYLARLLSQAAVGEVVQAGPRQEDRLLPQHLAECENLCEQFPDDPTLHVHRSALLFRQGQNVAAQAALEKAESLGGDLNHLVGAEGLRAVRAAAGSEARTRLWKYAALGAVTVYAIWIAIMFLVGYCLSSLSEKKKLALPVERRGRHGGVVWLYLAALTLGLFLFYISVPLVAMGLLAVTGALLVLMLVVRIIHVGLLYRGCYATWGVISSVLMNAKVETFGTVVREDQHPLLFDTLREVGMQLGTKPPDLVFLTPLPPIGVREDGKGPLGLFRRRRVMELGVPNFSWLTITELKSVIAHELAHFSHHDPAYGRFLFRVSASLQRSLVMMSAAAGPLTWINPFHWFYWLYLKAYLLLAAGLSRSREFLADERAAFAYGRAAFASALTKIAINEVLFNQTALNNLHLRLTTDKPVANLFCVFRDYLQHEEIGALREKILQVVTDNKGTRFDSHPTFSQRLAALEGLPEPTFSADHRSAAELLNGFATLEEEMTAMLTRVVIDSGYAYAEQHEPEFGDFDELHDAQSPRDDGHPVNT